MSENKPKINQKDEFFAPMQVLSTFKLAGTKDGVVSLARLAQPYGAASEPVLSIAVCLKNEQPDWKIHIPAQNLDELIVALESAKSAFKSGS